MRSNRRANFSSGASMKRRARTTSPLPDNAGPDPIRIWTGSSRSAMHADVLIIGAGASGGVAARHLAASGYSVVCLDQGHWTDPASYPGASPLWEVLASQRWSSSPAIRRNRADYPIDLQASDLGALNFNGVGGGTILYNAQWPRMRPDDFRVASLDGVADDWPLTYDDLRPFYEETEKQFGVSCLGGNPAYPDGAEPPMPAMPIGDVGLRVARAHAALGWHWWPAANAINSTGYAGRRPCVQRGACGQGCNEGAKGSTDVTHWPDALANGASLITELESSGSPSAPTAWPQARFGSTSTDANSSRVRMWCCVLRTRSAPLAYFLRPPAIHTLTVWPTVPAWSAAASCCIH
jgi:hypothetical protein